MSKPLSLHKYSYSNPETFFSSEEKTAAILLEVASVTKIKVAPDRDIRKVQKFLDKNQDKFEKIDPSRVLVGMNAVARFSEDGLLYRCRVTKISKDRVKVKYQCCKACSCVIF